MKGKIIYLDINILFYNKIYVIYTYMKLYISCR